MLSRAAGSLARRAFWLEAALFQGPGHIRLFRAASLLILDDGTDVVADDLLRRGGGLEELQSGALYQLLPPLGLALRAVDHRPDRTTPELEFLPHEGQDKVKGDAGLDNLGVLNQRPAKTDIKQRDIMDGIHLPLGFAPDIHPGMSPPFCLCLPHRNPLVLLSPSCAPSSQEC